MSLMSEDTPTLAERSEEELSWAGLALAETIRAAELAVVAIAVLLISPPLLILAVVVIVPAVAIAAVVGALVSAIALPVYVVRHLHRHGEHRAHARVHRLAHLGRTDSALAASRMRRAVGRAQAKLHAPR
jgi:hypothetical protein